MENKHDFNVGDIVEYISDVKEQPKGSCLLEWAYDYCLEDEEYEIIETRIFDVKIKGKLNPRAEAGNIPDEIWVNAVQMQRIQPR